MSKKSTEKNLAAKTRKNNNPAKCKNCAHARKCCGGYFWCTLLNFSRIHWNTNGCFAFTPLVF